jgi:hypothetical protein
VPDGLEKTPERLHRRRENDRVDETTASAATLALFLWTLGSAGAQNGPDIADFDDQAVTDAVEMELLVNNGVPFDPVDVETSDGVVTSSGTVSNLLAKERAAKVSLAVKGVRAVVNRIEAKPIFREDYEIRKERDRCALDESRHGVIRNRCQCRRTKDS